MTICLILESLPHDNASLLKLKRRGIQCSLLFKIECKILKFFNCASDIFECPLLKNFTMGFSKIGAFSLLEILSLVWMDEVQSSCSQQRRVQFLYLKMKAYSCSMVLDKLKRVKIAKERLQAETMYYYRRQRIYKRYFGWLFGEFWCKEFSFFPANFLFM